MRRERKFLRSRTRSEEEQAAIAAVEAPVPETGGVNFERGIYVANQAFKAVERSAENDLSGPPAPSDFAHEVGADGSLAVTLTFAAGSWESDE